MSDDLTPVPASRDVLLAEIYQRASLRRRRRRIAGTGGAAALVVSLCVALPLTLTGHRHPTTLKMVAPPVTRPASTTTTSTPPPASTSTSTPESTTTSAPPSLANGATATTSTNPTTTAECAANQLAVSAHPDRTTYNWNDTMIVTVDVTSAASTPCQLTATPMYTVVTPGGGSTEGTCYPSVTAHYYSSATQVNGLLGPALSSCPPQPVRLAPGSTAATNVRIAFQCGSGTGCVVSHAGDEQWHVVVEWDTPNGWLPQASFDVLVQTPSPTTTTTTTTSSNVPASTTTTSPPVSASTSTTPPGA